MVFMVRRRRGISVWMFSKVVMLLFLVLTFASVLGFINILAERNRVDSANALAVQAKDSIQAVANDKALTAQIVIPLPKKLPEVESAGKTREYSVGFFATPPDSSGNRIIQIALAWGAFDQYSPEVKFATAASVIVGSNVEISSKSEKLMISSSRWNFFKITKEQNKLCVFGCSEGLTTCTDSC